MQIKQLSSNTHIHTQRGDSSENTLAPLRLKDSHLTQIIPLTCADSLSHLEIFFLLIYGLRVYDIKGSQTWKLRT